MVTCWHRIDIPIPLNEETIRIWSQTLREFRFHRSPCRQCLDTTLCRAAGRRRQQNAVGNQFISRWQKERSNQALLAGRRARRRWNYRSRNTQIFKYKKQIFKYLSLQLFEWTVAFTAGSGGSQGKTRTATSWNSISHLWEDKSINKNRRKSRGWRRFWKVSLPFYSAAFLRQPQAFLDS